MPPMSTMHSKRDVWRFSDFTSTESFGAQDNRFPSEMHAVFSKDYADHGSWRVPKHGIAAEERVAAIRAYTTRV